jgi:hypothetical protein
MTRYSYPISKRDRENTMKRNPKCDAMVSSIDCDTDYPDFFLTTYRWGGIRRTSVECLNHAAYSEQAGKRVELIDAR